MADEQTHPEPESPDIHFEPIVSLPKVEIKDLEDEEDEILKLRAKLFRYDSESEPPMWKERGTGDVKILRHKERHTNRILMRRDKTLKICANHVLTPQMELKPNCGSDRAWVWSTTADFADEEVKPELLAIRFANAENAQKFKAKFDNSKQAVTSPVKDADPSKDGSKPTVVNGTPSGDKDTTENHSPKSTESDDVAKKLEELTVKDDLNKTDTEKDTEKTLVNGSADKTET